MIKEMIKDVLNLLRKQGKVSKDYIELKSEQIDLAFKDLAIIKKTEE